MIVSIIIAVNWFFSILEGLIFIRVFMSWIPPIQRSKFGRVIYMLTEPLLGPIRRLLAKSPLGGPGMILDFSPLIVWVLMEALKKVIYMILLSFV